MIQHEVTRISPLRDNPVSDEVLAPEKGKIILPDEVLSTYESLTDALRVIASHADKSAGNHRSKFSAHAERIIKAADRAEIMSEDLSIDDTTTAALKLGYVARELGPMLKAIPREEQGSYLEKYPRVTSFQASIVTTTYLTITNALDALPREIRSSLLDFIHAGKKEFGISRDKLEAFVRSADAFVSLLDEHWRQPDAAVGEFLRAARDGKVVSVTLSEVRAALREDFPDPDPIKGMKRFKFYRASFRRLAYQYFKALNESETNDVVEAQMVLSGHRQFSNVGNALINFLTGSTEHGAFNYPKKISDQVYRATSLTPRLLEELLDSRFLVARMNYLSNAMPYQEYSRKVAAKMSELTSPRQTADFGHYITSQG